MHADKFAPLILILLSAWCSASWAQTGSISGKVIDELGDPLIGVNVMVKGTVLGSATNMKGEFSIQKVKAGDQVLVVSMIGYQKKEVLVVVEAGKTSSIPITLAESLVLTDEVVVTAGRRPQSFEEIPVSISVLEGRSIEERAIHSLDDALRKVPGVNMTESQVNVRGSSGYSRGIGSRVLLLMDGVPVLAGDAGEMKFDAIPMFMIDRIEVVKGAGSALYGSSALGGVINVITKRPEKQVTRFRLHSGFYENPRYPEWKWWGSSPRWFNGVDVQRVEVFESGHAMLTGGVRHNQGYRRRDDFIKWNATASAGLSISPMKQLKGMISYAYDDRGNWIFWQDLKHALEPPLGSDLTERIHSTKLQAAVEYRESVSSSFAYHVRGSYYRTAYDTFSDTSDFSLRPADKTQSTAQVFMGQFQGTTTPWDNHIIVAGIEGQFHHVDARTYGNRDGVTVAVYAQDDVKLPYSINLSAGARFDITRIDTSESEYEVNPRVGATWSAGDGTVFRASYGWGFRSPSIAERFTSAAGAGLTTKPNPHLRSERSTSYELGFQQKLPIPATVDVALFVNDFENLVEPTIDAQDGRIYFSNITSARIEGAEVLLRASFFDKVFETMLGYTYIFPKDRTTNSIMKYRPRHLAHAEGNLTFEQWKFGVDFRYASRIEEIDRALALVVTDADKRVETFLTDVRLSYHHSAFLPLRITLSANNLFQYHFVEVPGNLSPIRNFILTIASEF